MIEGEQNTKSFKLYSMLLREKSPGCEEGLCCSLAWNFTGKEAVLFV